MEEETYELAAVNAVFLGHGNKARNLFLDVPFGPCLLVARRVPVVKDRHFEHWHLLLFGHAEYLSKELAVAELCVYSWHVEGLIRLGRAKELPSISVKKLPQPVRLSPSCFPHPIGETRMQGFDSHAQVHGSLPC